MVRWNERVEKITKRAIEKGDISFTALGLLGEMAGLEDHEPRTIKFLTTLSSDNEETIMHAMRELLDLGYVRKKLSPHGRYEWVILEKE